jgi:poly(3-hydroxybutyrate) depolymerase
MNTSPPSDRKRTLVYIPIIHTAADMGTLAPSIRGKKLSMLGRQGLARNAAMVEKMWQEIEGVASRLPVAPGTVRIYQDGLCRSWLDPAAGITGCCWNSRVAGRG